MTGSQAESMTSSVSKPDDAEKPSQLTYTMTESEADVSSRKKLSVL